MIHRNLFLDEKKSVLDALLAANVADHALCQRAVNSCKLISHHGSLESITGLRSSIAYVALRQRASGITLGPLVFIRTQLFNQDQRIPMDLLAHEVAHVLQFQRDGNFSFLQKYLWDYTRNRLRGLPDLDAYLAIPYEIEARHVASLLTPPHP